MGTRDLVIIRCCGRYYIYWNRLDSYTEGLGAAIVATVPQDVGKSAGMRQLYTRLSQQFEEEILCVSPKFGQPGGVMPPAERYARSYLALDDRLDAPPTQALLDDVKYWDNEWTYTLDLDRQLFARRILHQDTPRDLVADPASNVQVDSSMVDVYKSLEVTENSIDVFNATGTPRTAREILLTITMMTISNHYRYLLDAFYLEWTSTSFPFRELAFAILSIASGEISFETPRDFNRNNAREGFFLIPNAEIPSQEQALLPKFLRACHGLGNEPGSAPKSPSFWLGNVLVYLIPRTDLVQVEKAPIVTVVKSGLDQGLRKWDIRVTRSPLVNIIHFDDDNSRFPKGPRTRYPESPPFHDTTELNLKGNGQEIHDDVLDCDEGRMENDDDDEGRGPDDGEGENDAGESGSGGVYESSYFEGSDFLGIRDSLPTIGELATFDNPHLALIRFFDAAADDHLAGAHSRVFPNEILNTVMEYSDFQTSLSLAKASPSCRDLHRRKFRLNDDYAVVNLDCKSGVFTFTLEDLHSRRKICSVLGAKKGSKANLKLKPYRGDINPNRRSIVEELSFRFSKVSSKGPPYPSKGDMPVRSNLELLFRLPDYLYLGSFEEALRSYISEPIRRGTTVFGRHIHIDGAQYQCLVPHGYRELMMSPFVCSGMHIFLRAAKDESAEKWVKTIEYVVRKLHDREIDKEREISSYIRGRPVVVAFGRRVKLFYYVNKRDERPLEVATSVLHCVKIAGRCIETDRSRRLIDLIPSGEPLNLGDNESREKFEGWIPSFCSSGR
ncbi:uncharacterized protein BJX67DRAFT_373107 [Aspergillus lucknowensis]|uniref:F-box domain-containing protein n=1 Tax=Aspergillus lucknowensis TaxID=176173 RepID=A0ABR4LLY1_9EURO